jgi:hypothetical protein
MVTLVNAGIPSTKKSIIREAANQVRTKYKEDSVPNCNVAIPKL